MIVCYQTIFRGKSVNSLLTCSAGGDKIYQGTKCKHTAGSQCKLETTVGYVDLELRTIINNDNIKKNHYAGIPGATSPKQT